jgi:hypothetical protein
MALQKRRTVKENAHVNRKWQLVLLFSNFFDFLTFEEEEDKDDFRAYHSSSGWIFTKLF